LKKELKLLSFEKGRPFKKFLKPFSFEIELLLLKKGVFQPKEGRAILKM